MKIPSKTWQNFIRKLAKINTSAAGDVVAYMINHDVGTYEGTKALIDYAYAVSTKYGEAAAEMACQMYDAIATASKAAVPAAEPAATATYGEIAKTLYGTLASTKNPDAIGAAVGRSVKLASVDTLQKNALRDGAEWAWIPAGDTCPFCLMLASNGWQKASKKALKNGHASHIHNNCDCTYAVRFDSETTVEGYDPDALYDQYINAGDTPNERLNALRRQHYEANKDYINTQKRAAYVRRVNAKLPINEGQFETVLPSDNKYGGLTGQSTRLARAHSYPDNEGMFENDPRPREDGRQTDIIKPRNIMKEMNRSQAGTEALKYINENNIPVTLLYNVDVRPTLMGEYDPFGKRIYIYASNTKSARETAITVIHEAMHARLGGANTRKSEVICRLEELKHKRRDNSLTLQDLRDTILTVKKHKKYSKLPWR